MAASQAIALLLSMIFWSVASDHIWAYWREATKASLESYQWGQPILHHDAPERTPQLPLEVPTCASEMGVLPGRVHQAYSTTVQLTRWWRICSPNHLGARHITFTLPSSSAVPSFEGSVELLLCMGTVCLQCLMYTLVHTTHTFYGQLKQSIKMMNSSTR